MRAKGYSMAAKQDLKAELLKTDQLDTPQKLKKGWARLGSIAALGFALGIGAAGVGAGCNGRQNGQGIGRPPFVAQKISAAKIRIGQISPSAHTATLLWVDPSEEPTPLDGLILCGLGGTLQVAEACIALSGTLSASQPSLEIVLPPMAIAPWAGALAVLDTLGTPMAWASFGHSNFGHSNAVLAPGLAWAATPDIPVSAGSLARLPSAALDAGLFAGESLVVQMPEAFSQQWFFGAAGAPVGCAPLSGGLEDASVAACLPGTAQNSARKASGLQIVQVGQSDGFVWFDLKYAADALSLAPFSWGGLQACVGGACMAVQTPSQIASDGCFRMRIAGDAAGSAVVFAGARARPWEGAILAFVGLEGASGAGDDEVLQASQTLDAAIAQDVWQGANLVWPSSSDAVLQLQDTNLPASSAANWQLVEGPAADCL